MDLAIAKNVQSDKDAESQYSDQVGSCNWKSTYILYRSTRFRGADAAKNKILKDYGEWKILWDRRLQWTC